MRLQHDLAAETHRITVQSCNYRILRTNAVIMISMSTLSDRVTNYLLVSERRVSRRADVDALRYDDLTRSVNVALSKAVVCTLLSLQTTALR